MRQTLKHSGNTARSSGTTHMKRSLARRRHSTRNGSLPTPSTSWKQGEEENCAEEQEQRRQWHRKSTQQWTEKWRGASRRIRGTTWMTKLDKQRKQPDRGIWGKLTGKFQQTGKPVKDKSGNPLTTIKEQLKRWAEHFQELLNRPTPDSPPDIPSTETELPISCNKPSKAEIKKAIMTLRSGKAAGPDEIPAEAIKADIETAVNMLYSLFSKIWELVISV